jgi:hypothetical protein
MAEDYSWNMTIKEIWGKAANNPPDVPHYQKLVTLAHLKSTDSLIKYTRWLAALTFVLAICAMIQIIPILRCALGH